MQFLTKSIRPLINSRARQQQQSWVLSQRCHSTFFSTKSNSRITKSKPDPEPPKPTVIPYEPKISNSVDLVGYVIQPVQFRDFPNGKLLADTVISSDPKGSESESGPSRKFWIPVVFEGDLAHTANCYLNKDDRVHVTGHVFVDASPSGDNPEKEYLQVMVNDFQYIEGSKSPSQVLPNSDKKGVLKHSANLEKRRNLGTGPWFDLLDKPDEWCDYRESKLNGSVNLKYPDFKKKKGNEALWLNKAPKEILSDLKDAKFDSPTSSIYGKQTKAGEESWKDLVENVNKYWDNRLDKTNPKAPDFKHRETSVGLWLSSAPSWVIEKLPPPKSKASKAGEESWKDLMENMNKYWDNRLDKTNPKAPDFKHKETSVGLWLRSAPSWVIEKLPPPKSNPSKAGEESWKDLMENMNNWWDNRLNKINPKSPDFKHKETGLALWLSDSPSWVTEKTCFSHFKLPPPNSTSYLEQDLF